ncbi:MAG: PhoH family protein [Kiritimatiellae bacterium]|nr:PhoH family protein [Kiritimatiellia bacterium]MDD5521510.1 PhoH family protein [Kiritimatiellia bacterium]
MTKTFVLDTNVLLHNAESIESFADNTVVLPMAVIEELDKFKAHTDELGRNARQVIRRLDALRVSGNLRDGVQLKNGGTLKIMVSLPNDVDTGLEVNMADNMILRLAYSLSKKGEYVIFVSKDINARIKADALGLQAVDFEKQKVNLDELYAGYSEVEVSGDIVEAFFKNEVLDVPSIGRFPNEFVLLKDNEKHSALTRVVKAGTLKHLSSQLDRVWNIQSRNKEQRLAFELLMDPEIMIVTLVGQAGTGKTLLALASALQATLTNHQYDRILVSRPIIPMGKDIGYLPGAKEEKLSHWMQPIFDNLTYLLRDGIDETGGKKRKLTAQEKMHRLLSENTIGLEALTYIRGRSIPRQYVIIDEAQNLTPHEVKTIVSRSGEGTKMVLTGDPYQIDNPYLDASSNGLIYAAERLKEQTIHGHIMLRKSERSNLAAIAAEYL